MLESLATAPSPTLMHACHQRSLHLPMFQNCCKKRFHNRVHLQFRSTAPGVIDRNCMVIGNLIVPMFSLKAISSQTTNPLVAVFNNCSRKLSYNCTYLHLMLIQQEVGNETLSLVVRSFSNPSYSYRFVSNSEHWSHTSNMKNVAMMAGFRYQLDPTQNHLGKESP